MKKIYYSPKVKFVDIDLDCLLGNVLSTPNSGKVPDDPTDIETPEIGEDGDEYPVT